MEIVKFRANHVHGCGCTAQLLPDLLTSPHVIALLDTAMALRASLVQEVLKLAYTHRGQVSGCIDCRSIGARTGAFIGAFDHWLELHTYHDKQRPVPKEARAFLVQAIGIHPHARLLRTRLKLVIVGAAEPPNRVDIGEWLEVFNID